MSVRVVVADSQEVVRRGLASLFAGSDVAIVGEASNYNELLRYTRKHKPDVLIADVRMPDKDVFVAFEKINLDMPDVRLVVFSAFDNPTYVARAIAAGAHDYILKDASRAEILGAITGAAAGRAPVRSGELRRVASIMSKRTSTNDQENPLTHRENQVLRHMAFGLSNKEIAQSLTISVETVKEHVQNILRKLAVSDRTQAAVWAVRRDLV